MLQPAPRQKWQALKVTIPSADGTSEQTVEVPLVAADEQKMKTMMEKQEPLLSDVALEALQSTGHEVTQHRAYYPVQLEDGTQAVVPMDFVEVRNTSTGNDNGFRYKAATVGRASSQQKEFFQCKGI